ncbi:MAG TPA: hypothetical protein VE990_16490 [Acidimicrobiales bacterium]|nr:hypothetical protein [Acidimicrobiales bacterium]
MPQPEFVPVRTTDEVRPVERLPPPKRWRPDRPGEIRSPGQPTGPGLGTPGPDQGYALRLAHLFQDRLRLVEGEDEHDVVAGCVAVAMRRAALFGRAPMGPDLELAFGLFGFLGEAPADLVEFRRQLFSGAGHHYWDQRVIADLVPDETLRRRPDQMAGADWRSLISQ